MEEPLQRNDRGQSLERELIQDFGKGGGGVNASGWEGYLPLWEADLDTMNSGFTA